jgi:23S rRNA (cytosine1962-C5)-methyltransferase
MPVSVLDFAPLKLKRHEERRLRAGHLWIYSNEVDTAATPLKDLEPGQPVAIMAYNGKLLGTGYANPHSLLCARLISRDPQHPLSASLLVHRFKVALALRERLYDLPFYRLVHGEADGLPGLIVDRYGEICVAQITTAGMERLQQDIEAALRKVVNPDALLWRNDTPVRALEGLEEYVRIGFGEMPETVLVNEDDVRYEVALRSGQKTGWFFDQRDNRGRLDRYVAQRRVLDVFSYIGAWGIRAAARGAGEVVCVDGSAPALDLLVANAVRNGVAERVSALRGDGIAMLRDIHEAGERFDVVIVDPPAFIKRKKDLKEGMQAYRRLNERAMRVLGRDGLLVSCSCSYHMERKALVQVLLQAARHLDRSLQILEHGYQGADHPIHPAIPETAYLKAIFCRVLSA